MTGYRGDLCLLHQLNGYSVRLVMEILWINYFLHITVILETMQGKFTLMRLAHAQDMSKGKRTFKRKNRYIYLFAWHLFLR